MDDSRKRILGAFLVGATLVILAVVVKINNAESDAPKGDLAVADVSNERGRITVTDEDNDGIPDWQEALQKTEPIVMDEIDEEYEPETLTESFSIDFLQDLVLSSNYGEFGSNPEELAEIAANQMGELSKDKLYTATDIVIKDDNDEAAVRAYANQMAAIVLDNTTEADALNEAEILKQAYVTENPERLKDLEPILAMYKDMIERSLKTPVPSDYSKEHLDLINVYNAVYNDITAMKLAFIDPIKTVVRLKRYEEDVASLYIALLNLQKKMLLNEVTFSSNDTAYNFFVNP